MPVRSECRREAQRDSSLRLPGRRTVPRANVRVDNEADKREFDPKARCQIDVTAKVGTPNFEAVDSSTERLFVFDPRPRETLWSNVREAAWIVQDRAEWTKFASLFGRNPDAPICDGPDRQGYRYQWRQRSFRVSVEDVSANLTGMQNQTNNRLAVENLVGTVSLAVERLVYTQ